MKTLIELYDNRPIENVLASEMFRPERTVFLSPPEVAQSKRTQEKLREYFRRRGLDTELVFLETSLYNAEKVEKQLKAVAEKYPDCMVDITGGTDAALFACGRLCAQQDVPAFTYSRRRGCFFNIRNAPFSESLRCSVRHSVEDCFLVAGGALRKGRVDNSVISRYSDSIEPFFALYLRHRTEWTRIVNYIQRASQGEKNAPVSLRVDAPFTVKGERGSRIDAPKEVLFELEKLGFLRNVRVDERVRFDFADGQIRTWLRDIGSVLELYVYKKCNDTGLFNDVVTSAVVDWEGDFQRDNVTNEIDVMAMQGIIPVFISCKTCDVSTEALNELAILRDRFGGEMAKAAIVTAQRCRNVTRHRASELNISVIDLDDLKTGKISDNLKSLMKK